MKNKSTFYKISAILITLSLCALNAGAQDTVFKPSGTPIVKIYADYYNGLGAYNDFSGFRLTRAYLGYGFRFTPELSAKVVIDGSTSIETGLVQQRTVHLKNAYLEWQKDGFRIEAGIHNFLFFGLQERLWGYRYIEMQFMALYGMAPSADAGLTAQYSFTGWLAADISITNGEGYKQLSNDNRLRYSAAIIATPSERLTLRVYADIYDRKPEAEVLKSNSFSAYAGYKGRYVHLGAEYDIQRRHASAVAAANALSGMSFTASVPIKEKWSAYGRFDRTIVENGLWLSSMGAITTGNYIIAGFEYRPMRQLRLSPNYRYSDNRTPTGMHEIFVSMEINW